ncbi:MAG: dethiobiotin synthase [Buchnera aphidicola (Floraphis choui)]
MNNCFFITGTDTNVGKTVCSTLLLILAKNYGYQASGYKPISSGNNGKNNKNNDAILLKRFSTIKLTYEEVNPFLFPEPISPHISSKKHNIPICTNALSLGLHNLHKKSNYIIVEGIGGWFTPLSEKITLADWVIQENLCVILVVGIKLGCINHAILTQKAILDSGLLFSGWIANCILPKNTYNFEYINILKKYLKSEFLGCIKYFYHLEDIYNSKITIKLPHFTN